MKVRLLISIVLCCLANLMYAQGSYIPLQSTTQHLLDRFEIKSGRLAMPEEFNTSAKYMQRQRIALYIDSFNISGLKLSKVDYANMEYLQNDNFEFTNAESTKSKKSILGTYKYKSAFFGLKSKDYTLILNPVTQLQMGYDTKLKQLTQINNRGIELRGTLGNKIGFYSTFSNEIINPNSWVENYYQNNHVIPGASYLKLATDTSTLQINHNTASAYLVIQPNKFIDLQFGHGRNFIGNGYRTFYISDFSRDHLFLRANSHFWKINYTNIWGQIYDWSKQSQRILPKRHFYATTYANVNLSKSVNIGLFQTIVFQRDSGYSNGGYDLEYLNPVIFYKPIENGLNSPDKAILGGDIKWNFAKHFQIYSQIVISEFRIKDIINHNGWFGNKWASQIGAKYIDVFGINNLDLQAELNIARPYMYTSFSSLNAYVNFNQNMAHPMGANFYESIGIIRYQPTHKLFLKATSMFITYGADTNGSNWGQNIKLPYVSVVLNQEFGNTIAQGVRTNILLMDLNISYMIKHNLFIETQVQYRKASSNYTPYNSTAIVCNLGVRWNFNERRWDF